MKNKKKIAAAIALALAVVGSIHAYRSTHLLPIFLANLSMGEIPQPRALSLPEVAAFRANAAHFP